MRGAYQEQGTSCCSTMAGEAAGGGMNGWLDDALRCRHTSHYDNIETVVTEEVKCRVCLCVCLFVVGGGIDFLTDTGPLWTSCCCRRRPLTLGSTSRWRGALSVRRRRCGAMAPPWAGGIASTARIFRAASD